VLPPDQPGADPESRVLAVARDPALRDDRPHPRGRPLPTVPYGSVPGDFTPRLGSRTGAPSAGQEGQSVSWSGFLACHHAERVPSWYRPGRAGEISPQRCRPPAVTSGSAVSPSPVSGGRSVRRQFRSSFTRSPSRVRLKPSFSKCRLSARLQASWCSYQPTVAILWETRVVTRCSVITLWMLLHPAVRVNPLFLARFRAGDRRRFS